MRLTLWTARPAAPWPARLADALAERAELRVVDGPTARRESDLDLYHLANDAAFGFAYRALLERPGVVLLEEWTLHELVRAEAAGDDRGAAYEREARRERGASGAFIARQVLAGRGGALTRLLPLNSRALDAALAIVVPDERLRGRCARAAGDRPVLLFSASAQVDTGAALVSVLDGAARDRARHARRLEMEQVLEATPLGRALLELRPAARELGLPDLPVQVRERVLLLLRPGGR